MSIPSVRKPKGGNPQSPIPPPERQIDNVHPLTWLWWLCGCGCSRLVDLWWPQQIRLAMIRMKVLCALGLFRCPPLPQVGMEVDCGCGWWVVVQLNSVSLFLFKRVALSVPPAFSHSLFRSLALPPELFRPQSSMKIHSTPRGDWLDLELGDVYVCVCG